MRAVIIDETSAGLTALQIYDNDNNLVWSHNYFHLGASEKHFNTVMRFQLYDDMVHCEDYEDYEGCDRDENWGIVDYNTEETTFEYVEWTPKKGFVVLKPEYTGQSSAFVDFHKLV